MAGIEVEKKKKKKSNHLIMDSHTLSNYKDLPIIHAHLDLEVDFVNKLLRGSVTHNFSEDRNTDLLVLDSKNLEVDSVKDESGNRLNFEIGNFDELLGSKFSIQLNKESKSVTIFYKTTSKSEALDWLIPNQTAGKNFPFMYTQGQSIFTRSCV
jgi:aminopeptidase N